MTIFKGQIEFETDEYKRFVNKFKPKKTTDDCYTPVKVYEAVANWVVKEYGVDRKNFVRPFFPGGDYEGHDYAPTDIVVDNPPFSILSKIISFYEKQGILFFLFCPALTAFSSSSSSFCVICAGASIEYENKASVNTSFITNLEDQDIRARSAPDLNKSIKKACEEEKKEKTRTRQKYSYPANVVTAAMINYFSAHDTEYTLKKSESIRITGLDQQRAVGKTIFGSGYLLSEKAAAEKAAAEKAAAEKAAAEKAAAEKAAAEKAAAENWQLSEREWEIVRRLSNQNKGE